MYIVLGGEKKLIIYFDLQFAQTHLLSPENQIKHFYMLHQYLLVKHISVINKQLQNPIP